MPGFLLAVLVVRDSPEAKTRGQCCVGSGVEAGAAGLAELPVGAGTVVDNTESVPLPP